jgi:hypothetical protein
MSKATPAVYLYGMLRGDLYLYLLWYQRKLCVGCDLTKNLSSFHSYSRVILEPKHIQGHTHTHTYTIGRTPLDEGSGSPSELYLTKHNTHKRQKSYHGRIRTRNPGKRLGADPSLGLRVHPYGLSRIRSTKIKSCSNWEQRINQFIGL